MDKDSPDLEGMMASILRLARQILLDYGRFSRDFWQSDVQGIAGGPGREARWVRVSPIRLHGFCC
jgi:hypothetical protein